VADTRGTGLQTIFAFFLGLMVTSFVGVGVYTFYPSPDRAFRDQVERQDRREQAIRNFRPDEALTPEDRASLQAIADERAKLADANRVASEAWGRRTSIILITFATLAMAVSLLRAVQLPVISNGLLLGGVFTMLYGVGWSLVSDTSTGRFLVMTAALAITIALGYVRFVYRRDTGRPGEVRTAGVDGLTDLERRVRSLEERLDKAAAAFGQTAGSSKTD
jgi:hypothetical protein